MTQPNHKLSPREQQVYDLLGSTSLPAKEIAHRLSISPRTVSVFVQKIGFKLGIATTRASICKHWREHNTQPSGVPFVEAFAASATPQQDSTTGDKTL